MTEPLILVERTDPAFAVVALNRPDRRNALSIAMMEQLCRTIDELARDSACRVLLLQGTGRGFCAGLDLREAANLDLAQQSADCVHRTLETVGQTPLITLAAVHGFAVGGGVGLMAACDLVIASDDIQIGLPEVRRGLVPALILPALSRRCRDSDLRELLLCGQFVTAQRAQSMGIVNRTVPPDQLLEVAKEMARQIRRGAPETVRRTKRLLNDMRQLPPEFEARLMQYHRQARVGDEAQEGLNAYLHKREPRWVDPNVAN